MKLNNYNIEGSSKYLKQPEKSNVDKNIFKNFNLLNNLPNKQ